MQTVIAAEREAIREHRTARARQCGGAVAEEDGVGRPRFSVAFSGGGVRACAFQAGVLWRLAHEGLLKDVEYLAAVSGGSYIASAFASHVVEAGRPKEGEDLDAWYRGLVAKTLCRMQSNWPYLARDLGKGSLFGVPKDGSSSLPRICDIPLLLIGLILTVVTKPILVVLLLLIPLVEVLEFFFGAEMRLFFCFAPGRTPWSHLGLVNISKYLAAIVFATFIVGSLLKMGVGRSGKKKKAKKNRCWYVLRGSLSCMIRMLSAFVLVLVITSGVTITQLWKYELMAPDLHNGHCRHYLDTMTSQASCSDARTVDFAVSTYNSGAFSDWQTPATREAGNNTAGIRFDDIPAFKEMVSLAKHSILLMGGLVLVVLLVGALLLTPLFPTLFSSAVIIMGPLLVIFAVSGLLRWRVFGPVTGQSLVWDFWDPHHVGLFHFSEQVWLSYLRMSLVVAMLLTPGYHNLIAVLNRYYRRSLRKAFFAGGKDRTWEELRENEFLPFLLFTGTLSDFMRPDDTTPVHMISFSTLHTGCERTGFVRTPMRRSVSKIVSLSGAAIDAFVMAKNDEIKYRFWLDTLSLYMGNYITFRDKDVDDPVICGRRINRKLLHFKRRLPSTILFGWCYLLLLVGAGLYGGSTYSGFECWAAGTCIKACTALWCGIVTCSFFYGAFPVMDFLLCAPMIRTVHQVTQFYQIAEKPPSLVYVTDGGVEDTTGLVQLVKRRCERILLVFAGNDKKGTLKGIKKAMKLVVDAKLGSFYDPVDPRRNLEVMIDEYGQDPDASFLQLGVLYGWGKSTAGDSKQSQRGRIHIVQNRLPSSFQDVPVAPLLTEEEILKPDYAVTWARDKKLKRPKLQRHLGGCCCDQCHALGCNRPRMFPSPATWNQFLTPQVFNSLCRLGFRLSDPTLKALLRPGVLTSVWEENLDAEVMSFLEDPATDAERWARQHVPPPMAQSQVAYAGGVVIDIRAFAKQFQTGSGVGRIDPVVHDRDYVDETLKTYYMCDKDKNGFLSWSDGEVQLFIKTCFERYGLAAPNDYQMYMMYVNFDRDRNEILDARECLQLVDALLRSQFLAGHGAAPAPAKASEQPAPAKAPSPASRLPAKAPTAAAAAAALQLRPLPRPPTATVPAASRSLSELAALEEAKNNARDEPPKL